MLPQSETENLRPSWLTKQYLTCALALNSSEPINVRSFSVKRAVPPGNNFISLILRVVVNYEKGKRSCTKSLIVKIVDPDPVNAQRMDEHGFYKREIIMFGRILPKMDKIFKRIDDNDQLAPKTLAVDSKTQTLVFEDLKERGFKTGNCKIGLDQSHVDIILRKVAKFHACSMVLQEQGEESYNEFNKGIMAEDKSGPTLFFSKTLEQLIEEIGAWEGYEYYRNKLELLKDVLVEQGIQIYKISPGDVCVLNHGDLWTTNMMFKYDDNDTVQDAVLVGLNFISCTFEKSQKLTKRPS